MKILLRTSVLFLSLCVPVFASDLAAHLVGTYANEAIVLKRWRSTPHSVNPTLSGEIGPQDRTIPATFSISLEKNVVRFVFTSDQRHSVIQLPFEWVGDTGIRFRVLAEGSSEGGGFSRVTDYFLRPDIAGIRLVARSLLRRKGLFGSSEENDEAEYIFAHSAETRERNQPNQ